MEEEGIYDFSIYSIDRHKFRAGEIDGFREIHLMVEGIGKRRFERLGIKGISGEKEGLERFHAEKRGINGTVYHSHQGRKIKYILLS